MISFISKLVGTFSDGIILVVLLCCSSTIVLTDAIPGAQR